ncbi:hypothetical protein HCA61_00400 [Rhodococcus sp. HNM0563]|uniref:hypothetical protein n=1 Tax=unclassified Rhodococcus (in: high G+C Gram-positive bacteria) TaxID=192944 RepID=UPI001469A89F|nr:hypothetical protein [Rhodococcus sp. F64268]MCK0093323.1 hypothetical protein [Rhodococcus sp. F64268]NLU60726.1 hypothetical protein [Rhodococcus sp. HNM0563]
MADFDTTFDTGTDDAGATGKSRRGPSILLLLSAIAALVVSGWALIGPFSLDFLGTFDTGWILVGAAIVIGAILVLIPGRRKNHH